MPGLIPRKIPWRRARQSTPVFLPGESHGRKNLAGYSPWGCKEDMTEQLNMHAYIILHRASQVMLVVKTCLLIQEA